MSMIIDGTNGLTFNNATTQASGGKVIQVVSSTITSNASTTSTSFVSSGINASITPLFSTSKILILVTFGTSQPTAGTNAGGGVALYRGTTALQSPQTYQFFVISATATNPRWMGSINYLDSPATTSSVTYNLYYASYGGAQSFYIGEASPTTITIMEISA